MYLISGNGKHMVMSLGTIVPVLLVVIGVATGILIANKEEKVYFLLLIKPLTLPNFSVIDTKVYKDVLPNVCQELAPVK